MGIPFGNSFWKTISLLYKVSMVLYFAQILENSLPQGTS